MTDFNEEVNNLASSTDLEEIEKLIEGRNKYEVTIVSANVTFIFY